MLRQAPGMQREKQLKMPSHATHGFTCADPCEEGHHAGHLRVSIVATTTTFVINAIVQYHKKHSH
jgi:hypothetical protein